MERVTITPTLPYLLQETGTAQTNVGGLLLNAQGGNIYGATIVEATSAADVVSVLGAFGESVAETASAADSLEASGAYSVVVAEIAAATDTVILSSSVLVGSVVESSPALDTVSSAYRIDTSIAEVANAADEVSAKRVTYHWFLSFAQVTPPPELQGPGNPGKLFGDFRYEEED